jgi:hypothetical protein
MIISLSDYIFVYLDKSGIEMAKVEIFHRLELNIAFL